MAFVNLDLTYKNIIEREFSYRYPQKEFSFFEFSLSGQQDFQNLMICLLELKPQIVYFDFTFDEDIILAFLYFFGRDNFFQNIPLVGLSESKRKIVAYRGINIDFVFVKGREVHDMVYAPMAVSMPHVAKKSNFAQAIINQKAHLMDDMRIDSIAENYLHVESNFLLKLGEVIEMASGLPAKNIPSKKYRVKSIKQGGLRYNFRYSYDLEPLFVDRPEFEYSEYEKEIKRELSEVKKVKKMIKMKRSHHISIDSWKGRIQVSQARHKEWVGNRVDDFLLDKKAKVLVVDSSINLAKENHLKTLEGLPYYIYFQTRLRDDLSDLELMRPDIIGIRPEVDFDAAKESQALVFDFDVEEGKEEGDGEKEMTREEKEELEKLSQLITKIKSLNGYRPVVILFRAATMDSKALQETYTYPLLISYGGEAKLDTLSGMIEMREAKRKQKKEALIKSKIKELRKRFPLKYRNLRFNDFTRPIYFLDRKNPLSLCSLESEITIYKLTESEISFFTERELPLGNFRIDFPVAMSIHIIPVEKDRIYLEKGEKKLYRALIHSVYETDKKFLRQYVNEFFSPDKNKQREKEEEEYWNLHSKMLQMQDQGEFPDSPESPESSKSGE